MHVYCVPRGVRRPDIAKEILLFALWSLDSALVGKWSQIYTLDVTTFKFNILFVDRLEVQVFCKNSFFLVCTNYSVFDLVSQHNGLFSGYHVLCAM